jgi:hypothetical protein
MARIYEEPISAKTPENPPHCHVPLNETSNEIWQKGKKMAFLHNDLLLL